ncbi:hypothetical protein GCM10010211_58730 [Streptomyces albospinus]|uniref:Transposase n=1 Tax=Streptomyces albospinus TaxID=285515 RepID=A0ABQ2VG63_9ACTN|nr:hypothetical protein GCM10010211_58730 [Streptomyces albospinus]
MGRSLPGNHNDCTAWELPGVKDPVGSATAIADGGYRGTNGSAVHRAGRMGVLSASAASPLSAVAETIQLPTDRGGVREAVWKATDWRPAACPPLSW